VRQSIIKIDEKTTTVKVGEKSENNNLPHREAFRVIITRSAQNNDLILAYFQDDNRLAPEIISGDNIARVSVRWSIVTIIGQSIEFRA